MPNFASSSSLRNRKATASKRKAFGSSQSNSKTLSITPISESMFLQPMGLEEAFPAVPVKAAEESHLPEKASKRTVSSVTQVSDDPAVAYLRRVAKHSERVSPAEEIELAKRIEAGDRSAKQQLVQANLRLVLHVAKRYAGKGADFADLVQEGNLGLMKAVEKFNYRLGYRFSTYAVWWIHQSVGKAFAEHDRLIRLPGHVVDRVNQLRKLKEEWAIQQGSLNDLENDTEVSLDGDDLEHEIVDAEAAPTESQESVWAKALGCTLKKIQQLNQLSQKMLSLEAETQPRGGGSRDEQTQTLADTLADDRWQPEKDWVTHARPALIARAMHEHLTPREREILCLRFGLNLQGQGKHSLQFLDLQWAHPSAQNGNEKHSPEKATLEAIGQTYGVTRECIRQTERRALSKLRTSPWLHRLMED